MYPVLINDTAVMPQADKGVWQAKPLALVVTTDRWYPTVRLAMALGRAGFVVEALCPAGHPLGKTNAVRRLYDYNGLRPLESLVGAARKANPALIIPADDLATKHLHDLHARERGRAGSASKLCDLIELSLGPSDEFPIIGARSAFIQMADTQGIRVPKTEVLTRLSDLHDCIVRLNFPLVLKADGTSGGDGVKVVRSIKEAEAAFHRLQSPPLLARAIKRSMVDRDLTLLRPSLSRRRRTVNAQAFVPGREATSTMACWNGAVLAALHFEVLQKVSSTGHATVLRLIEHAEMHSATQKIARRLKLSGLYGLDFILEAKTERAFLIEINPRTTQVGHLALGAGRDLPAALYAALTGSEIRFAPKATEKDTIVLFPHEWARDPASSFLQSGYHDVPWEQPALVNECIARVLNKAQQRAGTSVLESDSKVLISNYVYGSTPAKSAGLASESR